MSTPTSDGMIGTWVFYHLLTTFDYAGRSLILRRRTPETASKARADANGRAPSPCRCGWPVSSICTAGAASPAPAHGWWA